MTQTPPPLSGNVRNEDMAAVIREAALLKAGIDRDKDRLKRLQEQITARIEFPEGKATGHLAGGGYSVRVSMQRELKWNQEKLENLRNRLGDTDFFQLFGWRYAPRSGKAMNAFLAHGDHKKVALVRTALEEENVRPNVTYARLDEE